MHCVSVPAAPVSGCLNGATTVWRSSSGVGTAKESMLPSMLVRLRPTLPLRLLLLLLLPRLLLREAVPERRLLSRLDWRERGGGGVERPGSSWSGSPLCLSSLPNGGNGNFNGCCNPAGEAACAGLSCSTIGDSGNFGGCCGPAGQHRELAACPAAMTSEDSAMGSGTFAGP